MAPDSRPPPPPGKGLGEESHSRRDRSVDRREPPLTRCAPHVRGEPGAKSFVDDLILGQGFVRSRAATSLRSIESQPSTQDFVSSLPRRAWRPSREGPRRRRSRRAGRPSTGEGPAASLLSRERGLTWWPLPRTRGRGAGFPPGTAGQPRRRRSARVDLVAGSSRRAVRSTARSPGGPVSPRATRSTPCPARGLAVDLVARRFPGAPARPPARQGAPGERGGARQCGAAGGEEEGGGEAGRWRLNGRLRVFPGRRV